MISHAALPEPGDPRALYIVDLYAYVFRFASGSGRWATENFARWMGGWLLARKPARVIAADDFGGTTFRHKRLEETGFPAYKGDRKRLDDDEAAILRRVRGEITELVEDLGIPIVSAEGFEADDVIATITEWAAARRWYACDGCTALAPPGSHACEKDGLSGWGEPGRSVVIVGQDRDLLQLVGPREPGGSVVLWDGYEKVTGPTECLAEMGVPPTAIPDYFALVGGKNNLPGVPRIGKHGAVEILKQLEGVEHALSYVSAEQPAYLRCTVGAAKALREHTARARIGLELARLRTDVPLDFEWIARDCVFSAI